MIPYKPACNSSNFFGAKKASRLTSWGTIPIDALTCLGFLSISNPQTLILPEVFDTIPPRILRKVVFPAPFGPSKPKISPCLT